MELITNTHLNYVITESGQVFTDFKDQHTISVGYAFHSDRETYSIDGVLVEYDNEMDEYIFSWMYTDNEGKADTWEFLNVMDDVEFATKELHDLANSFSL